MTLDCQPHALSTEHVSQSVPGGVRGCTVGSGLSPVLPLSGSESAELIGSILVNKHKERILTPLHSNLLFKIGNTHIPNISHNSLCDTCKIVVTYL